MKRTVATSADLGRLVYDLGNLPHPFTVTIQTGKPRSLSQNALFHQWMGQIAQATHDDPASVKAECHIRWGIPIFRGEDEAYADFIAAALGGRTRAEVKRMIEAGYIPCTSLMPKPVMARYMDAVWREYSPHVNLTDPEGQRYEHMAR